MRRDPLAFLSSLASEYGDVVRLRFWLLDIYVIRRPEHVKHVLQDRHAIYTKQNVDYRVLKRILGEGLVTSNGRFWLQQRRLMQPAFHRSHIAAVAAITVDRTRALLATWQQAVAAGTPIDVQDEMKRLSLDIVTRALFGVDVNDDARTVGDAFHVLSEELIDHLYSASFFLFLLRWLPTRGNRRARAALQTIDRVVQSMIDERRSRTSPADDVLTRLLHARDEGVDGRGMDDGQIRDELVTLLLAGHETTAMALSWSWYLLDRHPAVAERLRAEVAAACGDRDPTVDDLPRLGFVTQVLEEAMRIYPPAWILTRIATEADEIGDFRVPAGTIITLSPYLTHHSPEVWPDPERFDPDRFTAERSEGRPRFAYFPFAGGPRQCIGNEFALTEATLVLATIARRHSLALVPGRAVVPQPLITLRPRGGLPMIPRAV